MTKLDVPRFTGPLDPPTIIAWLNKCEDVFEGYEALNPGKITPALQILFARIAMEEPTAAKWWEDNRTVLKALTTWLEFATKMKERFNPEGWKVAAVMSYYSIKQGKRNFRDFSKELQAARTHIGSGTLAIKDFVFKCHLLFFANRILTLRVIAIPSLDFEKVSVDALLNMMTTTWDALVAEGNISQPPDISRTSSNPVPTSSLRSYALPDLTYAERQTLKAAGGCYHCRKTPASKGWLNHLARDCPGDAKNGIPPRKSAPASNVAAVLDTAKEDDEEDNSDDDYGLCAVVGMSPCPSNVIGDGTDSDSDDFGLRNDNR